MARLHAGLRVSDLSRYHAQGVIKMGDKRGESKVTLVYGQMNEPPGARARVALTGKSMEGQAMSPAGL